MEGKFTEKEKILLLVTFVLIIITFIIKSVVGTNNTGSIVMLGFTNIMLYVILLVCALFPATWRMTENQKLKIDNIGKYQSRYKLTFIILNFVVCMIINVVCMIINVVILITP